MKIITPANSKFPLFILALIGSVIVTLGGYFYYQNEKQALKTEKHAELKAIASLKVDQLVQWQKERLSEAIFFSNNKPFIQSVFKLMSGLTSSEEYLQTSLTHIQSNNRYENIFILNPDGELVFNLDTNFIYVDKSTILRSKQAIATNKIIFTDFYDCNAHNSIHYDIIAPLIGPKEVVFATLVFRVNPEDYLFPLIQDWPTPSKTAETLLVRKEADSAVFINTLRHNDALPLTLKIPLSRIEVPAVRGILGLEGIYEGTDYRGRKVLSVIGSVPNTPWFMVAKVDREEILKDLHYRTGLIIAITILLIFAVGVSLAWFYHHRQLNIYRQLLESEKELHQSHEEFRATLYSIGDGVITTDKKGVVKQLNPVAENLTGWKESEARGKALEEVFNIINEETRLKVESPVNRVLKSGLIVGLANHTLLISKDGKELPIADSGAPIKNRNGEIEGVVMVFRDQTEERESIRLLGESEKRFKSIFELASLGIAQVDANNGDILTINRYFEIITGFSKEELLTMSFLDLTHPDDRIRDWEIFSRAAKGEIEYKNEKRYVRKDGSNVWVRLYVTFIRDESGVPINTVAICEDISERRKAETDLIESEEKYKSLFNSIRDAILVADTNRIITQCNPAFHDLFGFSQEEIVGKETSFIYKNNDEFLRMGQRIKESSKTNNFIFSVLYKKRNGDVFSGETNVFYLKNANDETIGAIGMIRDVTERERAEDALRNSEKQFRQLVDSAPQGIYVQTNRRFAYLNPIAVKLFGAKTHEELIGEPVIDRFHPDFHEVVKQRIEQLNNEQKEVPSIEEVCLKMDETPFDVEVSAVPINYQGENGALVFFHDITERKKADKELIELKNELENMVAEKTKELKERIADLERFHEATIERELRIKELRDEIKRLKGEA